MAMRGSQTIDGDVDKRNEYDNENAFKKKQQNKTQITYIFPTLSILIFISLFSFIPTSGALSTHSEWVETYSKVNEQPAKITKQHHQENSGYFGCLYSNSVCNENEICFNDSLFGRCIGKDEDEISNTFRAPSLNEKDFALLTNNLQLLLENGFEWTDSYTQCVIQNTLATIQDGLSAFGDSCDFFQPNTIPDEEQSSDEVEQSENAEDIMKNLEILPDLLELAKEKAVVPKKLPDLTMVDRDDKYQANNEDQSALEDQKDLWMALNDENYLPQELKFGPVPSSLYATETGPIGDQDLGARQGLDGARRVEKRINNIADDDDHKFFLEPKIDEKPADWTYNYDYDDLINFDNLNYDNYDLTGLSEPIDVPIEAYSPFELDSNNDFMDFNDAYLPSEEIIYPNEDQLLMRANSNNEDISPASIKARIGSGLGATIFNRHERLDVKKPGPFFKNSANNFFLNKLLASSDSQDDSFYSADKHDKNSSPNNTNETDMGQMEYEMPLLAPIKDKRLLPVNNETPEENDSLQYVHIALADRFNTWKQGSDFVDFLAYEFGLQKHALQDKLIETKHVQFRVAPNPENIDAQLMARTLNEDYHIRNAIQSQLGVSIEAVEAGDRDLPYPSKDQSILFSPTSIFNGQNNWILFSVLSLSAVAAICILATLIILLKRRSRINRKKKELFEEQVEKANTNDEYQQLCRDWSRSSKKVDSSTPSAKVSSSTPKNSAKRQIQHKDSKESEGSSRSSTSSWSEEPNNTNMDISTGHMVLAYMEDHLKNKQRLDQEWVALCAYEAEPCATNIAFKAENKKKNRYPDKLPYDHNRVILNAMVNGTSSDYINASTVMDTDPRHPSYIVTQGPLSNTVADFWQMIWEQGCVVIVMLTRLQENSHAMCHRYWPEQGSEQYHIFEVHLVSEHVWCEDYLVRSVYLKNTRTGETRTVTQFHFKSWEAHGVPASTKALLEFRRKVNKSYRGRSCPICVHCSDGVGRSGTYALIDMVLNRMSKGCKQIDIAATLEHIRDQRGGMVQNRQQFEFCLMAVAEEVHAILKAMPQ